MYKSGLVPPRMALLGLIGGPLLLISSTGQLFDWWESSGTVPGLFVIPEFLWELSLGIYATVWGFRRASPILSPNAR
jgi:Domain of unknown function (DUF4386)